MTIQRFDLDFAQEQEFAHEQVGFAAAKRTIDIFVAAALLPVLLAVALVLMPCQLLTGKRLMFIQDRVGRRGDVFKIYKFRTMTCQGQDAPAKFATQELDRISRLGKFLRATRIDELPQIINVLKGEMSLVGPRPEQVSFYRSYEEAIPGYARRQTVRPGITGLAQLKYGYTSDEAGTARKLKWDLEYIDRRSLRLEAYIMWHTLVFVMGRLIGLRIRNYL